jgi:cytochrome c556
MGIGQQDIVALSKELMDPKTTEAQRDALMKKLEKMQDTMMAEMTKMSDPANIAKAQQKALEFGCERISVGIQGGNLTGDMRCAEKVGTRIALTGSVKFLGR